MAYGDYKPLNFTNWNGGQGASNPMSYFQNEMQQSVMPGLQGISGYGSPSSYQTMDTSMEGLFGPEDASRFGWNMPTAALGLGAVNSLGNLWGSFKANKLANQQFNFTKQAYETNLANSIKAYNTNLENKVGARLRASGKSQEEIDSYMNKNKLG